MSLQIIPTFNAPFYSMTTTLEGVPYALALAYNQRENCWYVSIADAQGVDILNGIKLVCTLPLLRKCADSRRPPGELVVFSSTADLDPPGLNDLVSGARCTLVYVTSDWLALIVSGNIAVIEAQLANNTQNGTQSTYGEV